MDGQRNLRATASMSEADCFHSDEPYRYYCSAFMDQRRACNFMGSIRSAVRRTGSYGFNARHSGSGTCNDLHVYEPELVNML